MQTFGDTLGQLCTEAGISRVSWLNGPTPTLSVVSRRDGDIDRATDWARKAFQRRPEVGRRAVHGHRRVKDVGAEYRA